MYILARKDNKLTKSQIKIANQASIILSALAKVGITALIGSAIGCVIVMIGAIIRLIRDK